MRLEGTFFPPGDKSLSHRIVLLSLIANGRSRVQNFSTARDCMTSLRIVNELGGHVDIRPDFVEIKGAQRNLKHHAELDCENSGTTIRLLMGILSPSHGDYILDGDQSLRKRPMERIAIPLRRMGASIQCDEKGRPPVRVRGSKLSGIRYELPTPSAQLKSAILLAGVQSAGETEVVENIASRDHTEILLKSCGANISRTSDGWSIKESLLTMPVEYYVPGDISSACFFICAAIMLPDSKVNVGKVLLNPTRVGALNVLQRMGAIVSVNQGKYSGNSDRKSCGEIYGDLFAAYTPELAPFQVHPQETPMLVDEVPILALIATQAKGTSIFHDVSELRIKESDRVEAVVNQLNAMGAKLEAKGDSLFVHGPTKLNPPEKLESYGDHRIAMTLRIAGLLSNSFPEIDDEECIAISYPNFNETLRKLVK